VQYGIPLIVWGEHGFAELTGMFTLEDMVEFTKWTRREHDMRGYEPDDLVTPESGVTAADVAPFRYPADAKIEELGVRGIYLSNFIYWDALDQARTVVSEYDFGLLQGPRERTFVLHAKTDDHANDVHDYMKYLKFGYGRATDDASMEVRHGRMSREEAIDQVALYDHVRPRSLDVYLRFLQMTEDEFEACVEPMRDREMWTRDAAGAWQTTDSVARHRDDPQAHVARVPMVDPGARTFAASNRRYFFDRRAGCADAPAAGQARAGAESGDFIVL